MLGDRGLVCERPEGDTEGTVFTGLVERRVVAVEAFPVFAPVNGVGCVGEVVEDGVAVIFGDGCAYEGVDEGVNAWSVVGAEVLRPGGEDDSVGFGDVLKLLGFKFHNIGAFLGRICGVVIC